MRARIVAGLLTPVLALGLAACTVDQTEEGELPEVEGGQLPEYDVRPADIDVDWDTATVRIPDVDVNRVDEDDTIG